MKFQDRRCLRCQEEFPSRGPGNRICLKCSDKNRKVYVPLETPREEGRKAIHQH